MRAYKILIGSGKMREFKFKYRLKNKIDGQIITVIANLYNEFNGTMQYPIELDKWEVLSIDEWTGLKDKMENMICENDIVEVDNCIPQYQQVEFIEGGFCLTNPKVEGYPTDINICYPSIGCQLLVVGNIYENSELLSL
jgi:hypothetical protein